jgi:phosphate-selective porin OprO/OprP
MQFSARPASLVVSLALALAHAGPASAQTPPPAADSAALEQRLRAMEETNRLMLQELRSLSGQYKAIATENKALTAKVNALTAKPAAVKPNARKVSRTNQAPGPGVPAPDPDPDQPPMPTPPDPNPSATPDASADDPSQPPDTRTDEAGSGIDGPAPGGAPNLFERSRGSAEDDQPPDVRTDEPEPTKKAAAAESSFLEGFKWETDDGEFQLVFHQETQIDLRVYDRPDSTPVNQVGFYIPRARIIFNGRITKPIEYAISFSKGLGSFDLLDAYLNFNYDDRFQILFGRFRVPYTYDWYSLSNQFLTTPERSVFAINYGYNRSTAIMGHGELFKGMAEYAVAGVNGPRNFYYDQDGHKDVLAYLNVRPFYHVEPLAFLKHLNVGGSLAYGVEGEAAFPIAFRTSANATDSPGAAYAAPAFLQLNSNVVERGPRSLWELHSAYYYKRLTLMGAWDSGYNTYGKSTDQARIQVPTSGFHVAAGFFVTGEEVERRTFVEPLHPFDLRKGKRGLGAVELQARFSTLNLGREIFQGGLADSKIWSNSVEALDAGVNWYLNKYVKIYFDWQHSAFGQPVQFRPGPGGLEKSSDLYWLRCQVYF